MNKDSFDLFFLLLIFMFGFYVTNLLHTRQCHDLQMKKMDEIIKVMEAKK